MLEFGLLIGSLVWPLKLNALSFPGHWICPFRVESAD